MKNPSKYVIAASIRDIMMGALICEDIISPLPFPSSSSWQYGRCQSGVELKRKGMNVS